MSASVFIDARGLLCPLPVLKARKKLLAMDAGTVTIWVDDPASEKDFRLFCEDAGYRFAVAAAGAGGIEIVIEKS